MRKLDRAIEIFLLIMFASVILLTCCSCGTSKHVTQLVEHTSIDTVYLSNVQYDSIYIYKDRVSEHHLGSLPPVDSKGQYLDMPTRTDTLYIKDVSIEYRYKLLRDTVYKTQVDSIPYQVTVTETKEITRPLTWYDHLTRLTFWFVIGFLLCAIAFKLRKVCKCPNSEALSNRCLIYRQFTWCLKFEKMLFLMIFNVPYARDGA